MKKENEAVTVKKKDMTRMIYLFGCLLVIVGVFSYYLGQVTTAMQYGIQIDLLKERIKILEADHEKENRFNAFQQITTILWIFDELDDRHIYYISANETHGTIYMASGDWDTGQNGSWMPIAHLKWNGERWILVEISKNNVTRIFG